MFAITIVSVVLLLSGAARAQTPVPPADASPPREAISTPVVSPTPRVSPTDSASEEPERLGRLVGISEWTSDTWTAIAAIVAFAALVQPWLLALWRRIFRHGTVDIHETGIIEIGFSGYGHTIGLVGILRALHKEMFVLWIRVQLLQRTDGTVRVFGWKIFRNAKLTIGTTAGQSAEVSFEIPAGLLVTPLQPHKFNILFADESSLEAALPMVRKLQQEWLEQLLKLGVPRIDQRLITQPQVFNRVRKSYEQLSNSETFKSLAALLSSLNYWKAGEYELTMTLQTTRPNTIISKSWPFTLPDSELQKLQPNIGSIMEEICGMPLSTGEYSFASASFNS